MICRLGLLSRISDFKPEAGFGVRAPLVDLDHEAQLPLPGAGVGGRVEITKNKRPGFFQDSFTEGFFQGGFYWTKSLNWFFSEMLGWEFSSRTGEEWPKTVPCLHRVGRRPSGERVKILYWRS